MVFPHLHAGKLVVLPAVHGQRAHKAEMHLGSRVGEAGGGLVTPPPEDLPRRIPVCHGQAFATYPKGAVLAGALQANEDAISTDGGQGMRWSGGAGASGAGREAWRTAAGLECWAGWAREISRPTVRLARPPDGRLQRVWRAGVGPEQAPATWPGDTALCQRTAPPQPVFAIVNPFPSSVGG